jgi:hypothetical protein
MQTENEVYITISVLKKMGGNGFFHVVRKLHTTPVLMLPEVV